jgi:hypothetical protein
VLWPNLVGKSRTKPTKGKWHEWKQAIADHCGGQCVYCAISEARFGGIRNFHIEHFRPKVKFPKLENDIKNLYLACAVCNVLKCDDWPTEPAMDHSLPAYPDPLQADYNALFEVSPATHEVDSSTIAGRYVIERILLNRAQLILERRLAAMLTLLAEFDIWVRTSLDSMTPEEKSATIEVLLEIGSVNIGALQARPYLDIDTKRPPRSQGSKETLPVVR